MKSKLFKKTDINNFLKDLFISDLNLLLDLTDDKIKIFLDNYRKLWLIKNPIEISLIRKNTVTELSIEDSQFQRLESFTDYFFKYFAADEDSKDDLCENIGSDLVDLKLIESSRLGFFQSYLNAVKLLAHSELALTLLQQRALNKGANVIEHLTTSVNFRAIFSNERNFGDDAMNYSPACVGFSPIINFKLSFKNDSLAPAYFECDLDRLKHISDSLLQTLAEAESAQKYLSLETGH